MQENRNNIPDTRGISDLGLRADYLLLLYGLHQRQIPTFSTLQHP